MDRLTTATAEAPAVEFIRHDNTTGAPTSVAEGASKPELVFNTSKVVLPMQKIASHVGASYESLTDFFNWQSYVTSEIAREVINVENSQLLSGSGTGSDVTGFLSTSGILTHALGTDTPLDAIEIAIAAMRTGAALAEPTLAVFHPNTWSAIRRAKDSQNRYLANPDPTRDTAKSIWGVDVLTTTQLAAGDGLLIDGNKFGRVWLRESLSL